MWFVTSNSGEKVDNRRAFEPTQATTLGLAEVARRDPGVGVKQLRNQRQSLLRSLARCLEIRGLNYLGIHQPSKGDKEGNQLRLSRGSLAEGKSRESLHKSQ